MFSTGSEAFNEFLQPHRAGLAKIMGEVHLLETVTALARNIDFCRPIYARPRTGGFPLGGEIAQNSGMSQEDIEEVRFAGVLHDIGKVGNPSRVLSKPARLTPEEYELVKSHRRWVRRFSSR